MEKLYLASKSPRRAQLLAQMGLAYTVFVRPVDETVAGRPEDMVCTLARRKAQAAADALAEGWVLAADTLVFLDDAPLGKPKDAAQAEEMLRRLSGREHCVRTGMCLMNVRTGEAFVRQDKAQVVFDALTDEEIRAYIASGEPMDKAGAYGIQGLGGALIREIRGDYYAVVGLSLNGLRALLKNANIL